MKIRYILISFVLMCGILSCKKDNFNYPKDTVGSSKIIYFPSVMTNGEKNKYIHVGDAYTDSGATAILNGAGIDYATQGTVDPNTPGIYNITYTAVNEQGYSASDWRTVVVIGDDVSANDFSGTYERYVAGSPFGQTCVWTKIADGIYSVANPGGASGADDMKVIAVNYTGTEIAIPHQISPDFGEVSSNDATYDLTSVPPEFSWVFIAGGYGTSLRTFVKQ